MDVQPGRARAPDLSSQGHEASDIGDTVLFLAGDESKYVTSVVLPVDAGCVEKLAAG